jgi:NADH-quinone oxidoreductase subunit A
VLSDYFPLLIFLVAVFVFGLIALFFPPWLAGHRDSAAKDLPYESGIVPRSGARRKFAVSFYLAVILKGLGWFGVAEMAVFAAILLVALIYVWRKGALEWGN